MGDLIIHLLMTNYEKNKRNVVSHHYMRNYCL